MRRRHHFFGSIERLSKNEQVAGVIVTAYGMTTGNEVNKDTGNGVSGRGTFHPDRDFEIFILNESCVVVTGCPPCTRKTGLRFKPGAPKSLKERASPPSQRTPHTEQNHLASASLFLRVCRRENSEPQRTSSSSCGTKSTQAFLLFRLGKS